MQHNINIKSIMDIKSNKIAKKKLLFICLGNICRSPAAHAVMQKLVDDKGLTSFFEIDSAGVLSLKVCKLFFSFILVISIFLYFLPTFELVYFSFVSPFSFLHCYGTQEKDDRLC